MKLEELKERGEAPIFLTEAGLATLSKGYLLAGETPKDMYVRVSKAAAKHYKDSEYWEKKFFDVIWKGWLCLATPVASNLGTDRGLPISCNSIHVGDSVDSIFKKSHELAVLSKHGAGVGVYMGDIRGRGSLIKNGANGASEGIVPWAKVYDQTTLSVSQGSSRRGASALFLPVNHSDIDEFLNIRRPTGDVNRRCLNIQHGICLDDDFMGKVSEGKHDKTKEIWVNILKARFETGEPYLFFTDNVNKQNPACYNERGLKVSTTNICTEIFLHTDVDHTFVCCLSSLNLHKWDEWKDTDLVETAIYFLDAVMQEYIDKASNVEGLESAIRFATKSRALGLGVLGWHSLLQSKMMKFDSFDSMMLNAQIFRTMRSKAEKASRELAIELGEPEWCIGSGMRNTHLLALAPTVSNALISGDNSQSIEPWISNFYAQKSAKGTFIRKNSALQKLLAEKNKDTMEVWNEINANQGSVATLSFLSQEEKDVFLTAGEINQHAIVNQASQRQKWIDQGQSINLFFGTNSDPKYIHEVHLEAWKKNLKSLYYLRSESVLRSDNVFRQKDECESCSG